MGDRALIGTNADFETGDFTGWTTSGSATISSRYETGNQYYIDDVRMGSTVGIDKESLASLELETALSSAAQGH